MMRISISNKLKSSMRFYGVLFGVFLILVSSIDALPRRGSIDSDTQALEKLSDSFESIAAKVSPAVVRILTSGFGHGGSNDYQMENLLQRWHSGGSGVILDSSGYIITNAHVIDNAVTIRVAVAAQIFTGAPGSSILIAESRNFEAVLVGFDSETDLAVLKIDAENLPALKLGDSDDLRQGELVLAFGSPLGLENSVSLGVVSSVARQLRPEDPMIYIQTDAPINPGNSGGPLVNTRGEVVGINTLIFSQSGGNEGIGFSAPSNIVKAIYNQIVANGRVRRGEIGVFTQTITPGLAKGLGLKKDWGVILADVYPGQPAFEAGLRVGDIVLSLDGKIMENGRQFDVNLYQRSVGDVVKIEALRGDSSLNFWVHTIERPADKSRLVKLSKPSDHLVAKLGVLCVTLDDVISERLPKLRRHKGVVVVSRVARSMSNRSRLLTGDVIYSVNKSSVYDIDDLQEILSGFESGDRVVIQVERQRGMRYLLVELE